PGFRRCKLADEALDLEVGHIPKQRDQLLRAVAVEGEAHQGLVRGGRIAVLRHRSPPALQAERSPPPDAPARCGGDEPGGNGGRPDLPPSLLRAAAPPVRGPPRPAPPGRNGTGPRREGSEPWREAPLERWEDGPRVSSPRRQRPRVRRAGPLGPDRSVTA